MSIAYMSDSLSLICGIPPTSISKGFTNPNALAIVVAVLPSCNPLIVIEMAYRYFDFAPGNAKFC